MDIATESPDPYSESPTLTHPSKHSVTDPFLWVLNPGTNNFSRGALSPIASRRMSSLYPSEVNIRALAEILKDPAEVEDDDDIEASKTGHKNTSLTPGAIGSKSKCVKGSHSSKTTRATTKKNKSSKDILGDIWEVEEVNSGFCEDPADPRTKPQYEITYRQRLSASNVFLPMSNLATGGRGEEDLVVRVVIPGDLLTEVTLEVTSSTLNLASPNYLLNLPLPRSVDQSKGVATWDPSTYTLLVTLPALDQQPLLTPVKN